MRYDSWDVLLFPTGRDGHVPFKEFRVACQVIPDAELSHCHGSPGLPIMTCFVPSIQPGAPFHLSVHCWSGPEISSFTKNYSKHVDLVQFQARVFIDGRLASSTVFGGKGAQICEWPQLVKSTFEVTKSGEPAPLRFPSFNKELQYQNSWNPGDDMGRIKVIISEGFPRDSHTMPMERVKNVVAFSFQHAPIDILETNGIAWPNPSMWRAPSLISSPPGVPKFQPEGDPQSHTHSPRRRSGWRKNSVFPSYPGSSIMTPTIQPHPNAFTNYTAFIAGPPVASRNPSGCVSTESFGNLAYFDWVNSLPGNYTGDCGIKGVWAPASQNNASKVADGNETNHVPDFISPGINRPTFDGEPMHISGDSLEDDPMPTSNIDLKVPTNTPTTNPSFGPANHSSACLPFPSSDSSFTAPNFAHSLTHSLLNQPLQFPIQPQNIPLPVSEVKSRKESRFLAVHDSTPDAATSMPHAEQPDLRRFPQPLFNNSLNFNSIRSTASRKRSPCSNSPSRALFSSSGGLGNDLNGEFGSGFANASNGTTPLPLRNSSGDTLNAGLGSGTRRNRNLTPASSKVIDDEDKPLRPSPHLRVAGFDGLDDDSD